MLAPTSRVIGQGLSLPVLCLLLAAVPARAQKDDCLDERPGHLVRSIKLEARWVPGNLSLPVKRGDAFTPESVRSLRLAFISEKNKVNDELTVLGKMPLLDFSSVRACGLPVPPAICLAEDLTDKCTDVVVRAYTLNIDALSLGSDVLLPVPRSNKLSLLKSVPPPCAS